MVKTSKKTLFFALSMLCSTIHLKTISQGEIATLIKAAKDMANKAKTTLTNIPKNAITTLQDQKKRLEDATAALEAKKSWGFQAFNPIRYYTDLIYNSPYDVFGISQRLHDLKISFVGMVGTPIVATPLATLYILAQSATDPIQSAKYIEQGKYILAAYAAIAMAVPTLDFIFRDRDKIDELIQSNKKKIKLIDLALAKLEPK